MGKPWGKRSVTRTQRSSVGVRRTRLFTAYKKVENSPHSMTGPLSQLPLALPPLSSCCCILYMVSTSALFVLFWLLGLLMATSPYIFPLFFPVLFSLFSAPSSRLSTRPNVYSGSLQQPFSLFLPRAGFTFPLDHPFEKTLGGVHRNSHSKSTATIFLIFARATLYRSHSPYRCSRWRAGFTFPLDHPFEKTLGGAHRNSHRDPTA